MIYWLGIKGYIVSQRQNVPYKKNAVTASILPSETVEGAIILLTKAMEVDHLYLNPALNLSILAQHSGLAQKIISAVLNQHLHKSFNEFINKYRVAAFKERMQRPESNQLTIAGIAMECGFNSQATFQRTFKELTGLSPSAFRKDSIEKYP